MDGVVESPASEARLARLAAEWAWEPCETMASLLRGEQAVLSSGLGGAKEMAAPIRRLTLRFVRAVEVARPVRELLDPAAPLLYAFAPDG